MNHINHGIQMIMVVLQNVMHGQHGALAYTITHIVL